MYLILITFISTITTIVGNNLILPNGTNNLMNCVDHLILTTIPHNEDITIFSSKNSLHIDNLNMTIFSNHTYINNPMYTKELTKNVIIYSLSLESVLNIVRNIKQLNILIYIPSTFNETKEFDKLKDLHLQEAHIIYPNETNYYLSSYYCINFCQADFAIKSHRCLDFKKFIYKQRYTGCNLTAFVWDKMYSYPYFRNVTNNLNNNGILLKPIMAISEKLSLNTKLITEPKENQLLLLNESFFINEIVSGNIDTLVGTNSLSENGIRSLSYTDIFLYDPYLWIVPNPLPASKVQLLYYVYKSNVWYSILICFCLILFLSYGMANLLREPQIHEFIRNFIAMFNMTLAFNCHIWPKSETLRLLLINYLIYSTHICLIYQGKLISTITFPPLKPGIESLKQLAEENLTVLSHIQVIKSQRNIDDIPLVAKLLKQTKSTDETGVQRLYKVIKFRNVSTTIMKAYLDSFPKYSRMVHKLGSSLLLPLYFCYPMEKYNKLYEPFNRVMKRIIESGLNQKWVQDAKGHYFEVELKEKVALKWQHLEGVFIVMIIGLMASCVIFVLEVISFRVSRIRFKFKKNLGNKSNYS